MTPAEVASALRGGGYSLSDRIGETSTSDSFEDQVQERVTGKPVPHPTEVPHMQTWKKGQESVLVEYALYPCAPKAVHLKWSTDNPSPSDDGIVATLEKCYGGSGWRLKPFVPK